MPTHDTNIIGCNGQLDVVDHLNLMFSMHVHMKENLDDTHVIKVATKH